MTMKPRNETCYSSFINCVDRTSSSENSTGGRQQGVGLCQIGPMLHEPCFSSFLPHSPTPYQQLLCDILHFIMLVNISIFLPCDLYLPQSWYFMDMVAVSNFEACEIVFIWAELRWQLLGSIPRGKAHITNFPDCITFYYNWAVHIPKQGLPQPASSADSLETEALLVHC